NETFTLLHSFGGSEGSYPTYGVVQANDGEFYGTTEGGGAQQYGAIFRITSGGTPTLLYSFTSSDRQAGTGLLQASDGRLYGATYQGGLYGRGELFSITLNGAYSILHSFARTDGSDPAGPMIQASDGNLYGTTYSEGSAGFGVVYRLTGIYPVPVITSLSPNTRNAGRPAFTLAVNGSGFQTFSTVAWNGSPLATTYVSGTQLQAAVPAALVANQGKAKVTVVTGAGGGTSNSFTFLIPLTTIQAKATSLTKDATTGAYTANISLKNIGYNAALNVTINSATLGAAATSTTLPVTIGGIAAGSSGSTSLTFPSSAGATGTIVTLTVTGSYTGGTFIDLLTVTLP
ncbi:MAG TPA: choice-of-anchor tandem repeat GloVer-containing protein, partial [Chthonomonadales bacterium]|nr:choice-of-anchor tandem repeat GloVer-containing protein [Chthonomonadales bacterium]